MYKHVLHDHLDGGLRPSTAKELAESINYKPLLDIDNVESFFDRSSSDSLEEYLEAFTHTIALMQNYFLKQVFKYFIWLWLFRPQAQYLTDTKLLYLNL